MKFTCDQCQAQYMISDDKVGPKGVKVRCKKCGNIITVKHLDGADTAAGDSSTSVAASSAGAAGPAGNFDDMFSGGPGAAAADDASYERAPTKVFTTADLQRVREEQMRAGGAPASASAASAPLEPVGQPSGGLAASAAAAVSEPASDEKPEWYVAINDDQIGPIARADLQARWDKGEVKRDTLAWKQGLADWQAVSAIGDLNWLTQRPQAVVGGASASASKASSEPAKAEAVKEPEKPAVTWRPSGASALAALAKEAFEEPKKEAPAPSPLGDFSPQPASDPFGGMPSFQQGPQTMWQMPQIQAKRGNSSKWIIIALVAIIVVGAGVGAYLAGYIGPRPAPVVVQQPLPVQQPVQQPLQPGQPGYVAPVAALQPGQPGYVPPATALQPGQPGYVPPAGTPAGTPPVAGYPPAGGTPPVGGRHKGPKVAGAAGETGAKQEGAVPSKPSKPSGGGDLDGLFNNSKPASNTPATLDRNQVLGVIKAAVPAFKACVERYNSGGGKTLPPKLILKFVIVPSGNTSAQEMASPELKGTSVDGCVVSAIRSMKFPEYQSGNIPVTFPIPIGN